MAVAREDAVAFVERYGRTWEQWGRGEGERDQAERQRAAGHGAAGGGIGAGGALVGQLPR